MKLTSNPLTLTIATLVLGVSVLFALEKEEPAHHAASAGLSTIQVEILPKDFTAGPAQEAEIRLTDTDGKPVTPGQLELAHTKKLHLLIIDESLGDYQHAHPQATEKPGVYRFPFTPRFGGQYTIWADVVPTATGKQEYAKTQIAVKGTLGVKNQTVNTTNEVNGHKFVFTVEDGQPLEAGKASLVKIKITGTDGQDFTALEPLMGAFAHMVGFTGALDSVTHVHPMGVEPTTDTERGGPELSFHVVPAKPGYLKLFVQTQVDGKDEFASFGFDVAAPATDAAEPTPTASAPLTKEQIAFLAHYEAVRRALAADDLAAAQTAAAALARLAPHVGGVSTLAASHSLDEAREAFKLVSAEAAKIAAGQPGYYVMACPMVKHGDWVQTTSEVSNPYLGSAMPRCGARKKMPAATHSHP